MDSKLTFTRIYLALVRRLHFLVVLALMVPFLCLTVTFGMSPARAARAGECLLPLYALTLTLAIPASFMYLLQEKVKNLGLYLLCCVPVAFGYLAALCYLEMGIGVSVRGAEQIPQALILLLFLLDAIRMRTNDNSRKKAKAQNDHSWTGDLYLLPLPSLVILLPFALFYVTALFLHSNEFAQTALVGSILYFFLVLPWHVLERKESFLESRHHISQIPSHRIGSLQAAALLRVLVPCALMAAAALMTSSGRHFLDLPRLPVEFFSKPEGVVYQPDPFVRFLIALGILKRGQLPPAWLHHLIVFVENVLTIFMTVFIVWLCFLAIRSLYRRFRRVEEADSPSLSTDGSGDEHISLRKKPRPERLSREQNSIRRRYRRTILRALGTPPEPGDTPSMMEQRANLPDTPETHALHEDYELARYSDHSHP